MMIFPVIIAEIQYSVSSIVLHKVQSKTSEFRAWIIYFLKLEQGVLHT